MRPNHNTLSDEDITAMGQSGFGGNLPLPTVGQSPYYVPMYRTFYVLLCRIEELEDKVSKLERQP